MAIIPRPSIQETLFLFKLQINPLQELLLQWVKQLEASKKDDAYHRLIVMVNNIHF